MGQSGNPTAVGVYILCNEEPKLMPGYASSSQQTLLKKREALILAKTTKTARRLPNKTESGLQAILAFI